MAPSTAPHAADTPGHREQILSRLAAAGREYSNVAVMFHSAVAAQLGLGATENKTLDLLERHGTLSPGDLARLTGLAPASVTGVLDRLQRAGFVRRFRDPRDGRRQLVEIERTQVPRIEALFARFTAELDALYAGYSTEELELLLDWLTKVTELQRAATATLTAEDPQPPAGSA